MKPRASTKPAFERLLEREASRPAATAEACPQAGLLAAWFDRALPADESAAIETHLAGCARCQELLAQLARTEPEVLYVHPKPAPARWTWHLRWATPLAAAAVLVLLLATQALHAPGVAPVPASAPPLLPGAERQVAQMEPSAQPAAPALKAGPGATGGAPASKREEPAPRPQVEGRMALDDKAVNAPSELSADKPSAPPPQPAPLPAQAAAQENKIAAPLPGVAGIAGASKAKDSALLTRAVASAPSRGQPSAFVPGEPIGWRYARPGVVLRTTDGGASWTEQAVPGSARLLALAAVSAEVCWAAGVSGAIVRTVDTATWQMVTPPVVADLVSIVARDERHATVRTADGIVYETSDGGASWRKQQEEE